MSATGLPSPRTAFLILAAEHIPTGRGAQQEFDDASELVAMRWDLPAYVDDATARRALAALRRAGWDFHQEARGEHGGRVLRLNSAAAVEFADTPGGRVDALLWRAGFDRYRYGVPVWGYRWDHLFDDPSEGSAYVTVHGPGNGSHADARHRRELTDAMVRTVEAAEGWRTLRPECLDHAFHALTPAY
ncbi:hypothetical protein GCM10010441_29510 [Kitasatospora paracochleata]|uniref:Uncharacterized protein n=1 Tax=Kitasatospora paracochleata TaxID=58354 RepID=A0ABT1J8Z5_9ACTN|nr:hypothetical protein [Kitasatospora paracochleata]MCP2313912.1 hypothetical protein [Kitasatospora paracochleata]